MIVAHTRTPSANDRIHGGLGGCLHTQRDFICPGAVLDWSNDCAHARSFRKRPNPRRSGGFSTHKGISSVQVPCWIGRMIVAHTRTPSANDRIHEGLGGCQHTQRDVICPGAVLDWSNDCRAHAHPFRERPNPRRSGGLSTHTT